LPYAWPNMPILLSVIWLNDPAVAEVKINDAEARATAAIATAANPVSVLPHVTAMVRVEHRQPNRLARLGKRKPRRKNSVNWSHPTVQHAMRPKVEANPNRAKYKVPNRTNKGGQMAALLFSTLPDQ